MQERCRKNGETGRLRVRVRLVIVKVLQKRKTTDGDHEEMVKERKRLWQNKSRRRQRLAGSRNPLTKSVKVTVRRGKRNRRVFSNQRGS
jgi:hypothetical protein